MSLHRWGHTLHVVDPISSLNGTDIVSIGGHGRNVHKNHGADAPTSTSHSNELEKVKLSSSEGAGQNGTWLKKKDFIRMKKASQSASKPSGDLVNESKETNASQSTNTHSVNGRLATFAITTSDSFVEQPENHFNSDFMEWETVKPASASLLPDAREYHSAHVIPSTSTVSFPLSAYPEHIHQYLRDKKSVHESESEATAYVHNEQLLIQIFGRTNPLTPLGDVWFLHIETQTWFQIPIRGICDQNSPNERFPQARYRHVSVLSGNTVVIHSGRTISNPEVAPHSSATPQTASSPVEMTVGVDCLLNDTWALCLDQWPLQWIEVNPAPFSGNSPSISPPARFSATGTTGFMSRHHLNRLPLFSDFSSQRKALEQATQNQEQENVKTPVIPESPVDCVGTSLDKATPVLFLHGGLLSTFMCDITSDTLLYVLDLSPIHALAKGASSVEAPFRILWGHAESHVQKTPLALPLCYSHTSFSVPMVGREQEQEQEQEIVSSSATTMTTPLTEFIVFTGGSGPEKRLFNSLACFSLFKNEWQSPELRSNLSVTHFNDVSVSPRAYCTDPFYSPDNFFRLGLATALWLRHSSCVIPTDTDTDTDTTPITTTTTEPKNDYQSKLLVTGGGSLCFSFGTYHSPSFLFGLNTVNNTLCFTLLSHSSPGSDSIVDLVRLYPQSAPTAMSLDAGAINQQINNHTLPTFGVAAANPALSRQGKSKKQLKSKDNISAASPSPSSSVPPTLATSTESTLSLANEPNQSNEPNEPTRTISTTYPCSVCKELFVSRNGLFKHIQKWGHRETETTTSTTITTAQE